ncbi:MAG: hypothetical protein ACTHY0_02215 [Mammaliicoccus vitulinus]
MAKFKAVEVLFNDAQHNYKTSVNPKSTDQSLKEYFINNYFNVGIFPVENMQKCINIKIS